jgi:hypothetical protein
MAKKTKLIGPITYSCWFGFKIAQKSLKKSKTMIWTEFLNWAKNHLQAQLNPTNPPDIHPPNPLNQPDRPKPINGWIIRELIFYGWTTVLPNTRPTQPMPTPK